MLRGGTGLSRPGEQAGGETFAPRKTSERDYPEPVHRKDFQSSKGRKEEKLGCLEQPALGRHWAAA